MNKTNLRIALCIAFLPCGFCVSAQNIYLTPYKKINVSDKQITSISFSSDAASFAAADQKGNASLYNVNTGEQTGKIAAPAPALFHDFINDNKTFLLLDNTGRLTRYNTESKESKFSEFSKGLKVASLD